MGNEADDKAAVVLEEFGKLPAKRRPAVRDNGLREWVPLGGIVVRGTLAAFHRVSINVLTLYFESGPTFLKCVALA